MQKKISTNRDTPPKSKRISTSVKLLWVLIGGSIISFILVLLLASLGLFGKLPSLQELENPHANLASEIYADDGVTLMGKIYTENRSPVDFKDISKNVITALIATEDVRFYDHAGIDAIAIGRAIKPPPRF